MEGWPALRAEGPGCPGIQPAAGIDVASRLPQAGSLDVAVHLVGIRFPGETPFPAGLPASMRNARSRPRVSGVQLAAGIDVAVHLAGIRFPGEMPFPAGLPASMPALP